MPPDDEPRERLPNRTPRRRDGVAVMNFVFATIVLIESGLTCTFGLAQFGTGLLADGPYAFGSKEAGGAVYIAFGVGDLIRGGLMVVAGVGLLKRRNYGRTLGLLAAGLALAFVLGHLTLLVAECSATASDNRGVVLLLFLLPILLWLGFAIVSLFLLGKVRFEPH